jgi:transcriptional regulator with XRE-family HTH domain
MTEQLGDVINQARRKRRWSLRQLAENLKKEDGTPISPQYLNDIELNRRSPSTHVLRELARELELDFDKLLLLVGEGEKVVREYLDTYPQEEEAIMQLFRVAEAKGFTEWGRLQKIIEQEQKDRK